MKKNSDRKTTKPAELETLAPLRVQIETRAYEIWIASGGGHGRDLEHWLQAETEILRVRKPPMSTESAPLEDQS